MHEPRTALRRLSPAAFAALGLEELAYVKRVTVGGVPAYAIHAADGRRLGRASDRAVAFAALRQHDLVPVSVH
jgi:hypothetical protein